MEGRNDNEHNESILQFVFYGVWILIDIYYDLT